MEVYHHTTNGSSGCSAQNPGELFFLAIAGEAALCFSYTNAFNFRDAEIQPRCPSQVKMLLNYTIQEINC